MPLPRLEVARHSPIPLYHQLAEHLRAAIRSGALAAGERIPNEIALAESYGMSRPTARRALADLVSEGLLVRHRGIGTMVTPDEIRRHVELTSLFEDLEAAGRHPSTQVLSIHVGPAPDAATTALRAAKDSDLVLVERVRFADRKPLALMHNWLPVQFADLTKEDLEANGLYRLLRGRGLRPSAARQFISARAAGQWEVKQLLVKRGAPLISVRRTAYDTEGRALEYGEHVYRSDEYAIEVFTSER